jgi:hypothetical protein
MTLTEIQNKAHKCHVILRDSSIDDDKQKLLHSTVAEFTTMLEDFWGLMLALDDAAKQGSDDVKKLLNLIRDYAAKNFKEPERFKI